MPMNGDTLGVSLYYHIPFCTCKCDYCHFYVLPDKPTLKMALMEGLKLEWEQLKPVLADKQIKTLYFGGGTPYLLGAEAIGQIIGWISSVASVNDMQNMEITLEANPENVDKQSLHAYRAAGINRISFGLQSLDDGQLITLTRQHTAKKGIQAVEMAFEAGFDNISIDLMYDLPGQTLTSWQRTLERAVSLPINHLSLYNLTIEPHTVFFKYRTSIQELLPDAETSKVMYESACMCFEESQLQQYEISAFAKKGFASRHNSGYWTGRPFLGLGPSAFSYWENTRYRNVANLSKYVQSLKNQVSPIDFSEKLPLEASQRELLAIGLRLLCGINLSTFERLHGPLSSSCRAALEQLVTGGFLILKDDCYSLTKKGVLFYDSVAIELI